MKSLSEISSSAAGEEKPPQMPSDHGLSTNRPWPQTDHPALQVATGGYEVVMFMLGGPWDVAAPALIVEEAGGTFTDVNGRRDIFSGTALFSNGKVHDAALRTTAAV